MERLVKGEIKMTPTIKNLDKADDEIRNNAEYNKRFLSEARRLQTNQKILTDISRIAISTKVLGF